jgi:hypothetical protein
VVVDSPAGVGLSDVFSSAVPQADSSKLAAMINAAVCLNMISTRFPVFIRNEIAHYRKH